MNVIRLLVCINNYLNFNKYALISIVFVHICNIIADFPENRSVICTFQPDDFIRSINGRIHQKEESILVLRGKQLKVIAIHSGRDFYVTIRKKTKKIRVLWSWITVLEATADPVAIAIFYNILPDHGFV